MSYIIHNFHFRIVKVILQNICYEKGALGLKGLGATALGSLLEDILFHLIFTTAPWASSYYDHYFAQKETESQKYEKTCPKSDISKRGEPGF